jgi:hypothetical protein
MDQTTGKTRVWVPTEEAAEIERLLGGTPPPEQTRAELEDLMFGSVH